MAKWPCGAAAPATPDARAAYWAHAHAVNDYAGVWSLTDDPALCERIVAAVTEMGAQSRVLVPGCGSRTGLQQALAAALPETTVVCTDFAAVIDVAAARHTHPRVAYAARDSTDLGWSEAFDAVVVVNAVLSDSDAENRAMLAAFARALRPGGALVGLFPSLMCNYEIGLLTGDAAWAARVDVHRSTFFEADQGLHQVFYSPLRLRRALAEAGLGRVDIRLCFLDTPGLQAFKERAYGLVDDDLAIYEYLVTAVRPGAAAPPPPG